MTRRSSPSPACVVMAGAVALRRRMPTLAAVAALVGLVGYVLATHDPSLASPPVAVVLTFYTLGRCGASRRRPWRLVLVAGLGLAATWAVSAQLNDSPANAVSSWLVAVMAPLAVGRAARPPQPAEPTAGGRGRTAARGTGPQRCAGNGRGAQPGRPGSARRRRALRERDGRAGRSSAARRRPQPGRRGPGAGGHRRLRARRDGRPSSHRRGAAPHRRSGLRPRCRARGSGTPDRAHPSRRRAHPAPRLRGARICRRRSTWWPIASCRRR